MKKLLEVIPFLLLIGELSLTVNNVPTLSQSIIIVSLAALCGYRLYAMEQEKPDYASEFQEQFDQYKEQRDNELKIIQERHENAMVHLERKVKELDSNYAKSTMSQSRGSMRSFEF